MTKQEQIKEMAKVIDGTIDRYYLCGYDADGDTIADDLYTAGYRKQSSNLVSIETVKKWLYAMAINNVGCVLDGDFSVACEEIISRLDGLERFAEEMTEEQK